MKSMYLHLEDGAVFVGGSVTEPTAAAGLVSFFTGVVGYQETITDPANCGKLLLYTYPLVGNYGINPDDSESEDPTVTGVLVKEYPPYHSNFRADMSLKQYLEKHNVPLVQGLDTRAILLHLRENGEMQGAIAPEPLSPTKVRELIERGRQNLKPLNVNSALPAGKQRISAGVLDFGASRSFYKKLADAGIAAEALNGKVPEKMDLIIVSDAPYFSVDDDAAAAQVAKWIGKAPIIGFSHGAAVLAKGCGGGCRWMGFGHHGVNVPVKSLISGRREITVQNHNYVLEPSSDLEVTFRNINDGSPEGFICKKQKAAGVTFVPDEKFLEEILRSVGVVG